MSSQPDVPAESDPPLRHTYDSLFGDEPAPGPPVAAEGPLSFDDPPGDAQPYLPPAARDRPAAPEPAAVGATSEAGAGPGWEGDPVLAARAAKPVDTGRLYHSAGAEVSAGTGAIPAIRVRDERPVVVPAMPAAAPVPVVATPAAAAPMAGEAPPPDRFEAVAPGRAATPRTATAAGSAEAPDALRSGARGLTYLGVVTVVAVPTLLVGLAQALIWDRVGWLTGLVLVATSCYAALTVRRPDFSAAIVVPPLAFLLTILVAGQLTLTDGASLLVREGFVIVRGLAENAPWILGATALAAIIVLVRARRGSG